MPLTTGKTISGNTAFGGSGGNARGYATQNRDGSFGNFRNTDGTRMFTGNDRVYSGNSAVRGYNEVMARQAPAAAPQATQGSPATQTAPAPVGPLSAAVWPGQSVLPGRVYKAVPTAAPAPGQVAAQPLAAGYVGLTGAPSLMGPMVARNDLSRAVAGPVSWTKGRTGAYASSIFGDERRGLPTASQDQWARYGGFGGFGSFSQ